jgi:serine/threonine-protein kinase SRPK3
LADLKSDNIMARLEDTAILDRSVLDEFENPLPQRAYDDRIIYISRNKYCPPVGIVTITDFGFAVCGEGPHYGPIQVETLRAPEVILDAGWTYSSDIWNLGVLV